MADKKAYKKKKPPEVSPYLFTFLLAGLGLWCFYDGWLTTNPKMLEHATINRVISGVALPWAIYDFFKVRKYKRKLKEKSSEETKPE